MRSFPQFSKLTLLLSLLSGLGLYAQDNIILKNGSEIQAKVLEVLPGQIKYRRQDNPDGPIYTTGTADVFLIKYANGTKDILGPSATRPAGQSAVLAGAVPQGAGNLASTVLPGRLGYHRGLFSRYFTDGSGERMAPSTVGSLLTEHPDALRAYRRGQSLHRWTVITAVSAVALVGAGVGVALLDKGGFGRNETNNSTTTNPTTDNDGRTGNDHRDGRGSAVVGLALAGGGALLGIAAIVLDTRTTVQFRRSARRYNQYPSPTSLRVGPSQRGLGVGLTLTF